ncbi:MAG TPA: hypothetical protein VFP95_02640, partial [Gammaproteobacteria bacterium]|nr:hypothetical protein [Gammaproteobacteria bacterium]
ALTQLSEGVKQKTFSVYAAESWANSGITVEPGDLIYVEAANSWSVSPNYGQASMFGYADTLNSAYAINNQYALGALLYRVRGSQYRNGYGFNQYSRGEADTAGRLEFTINDSQLRNNSGGLTLNIIVLSREDVANVVAAFDKQSGT